MAANPSQASRGPLDPLLKPGPQVDYFIGPSPSGRPVLRAALLDEEARKTAEQLKALRATQLRRFYGSVLALKREIEINEAALSDAQVQARLALLKAHVAYAKKRIDEMPDEFVRFIVRHVASVKTKQDFLYGFAPCFEAVVAYHKFFEEKKQ